MKNYNKHCDVCNLQGTNDCPMLSNEWKCYEELKRRLYSDDYETVIADITGALNL